MKRIFFFVLLGCCALAMQAQTTLDLKGCINRATERNIQIRQAALTVKTQELQVDNAKNARLPEVSAGVGQNFSFGRGLTANNTYESRNTSSTSFNVGASMPLYTGGRIGLERDRSKLNLEAALADVERLRENLSLQVAQVYLQVIYQMDVVAQCDSNLILSHSQHKRVQQQIAAGRVAEVELPQAAARIAQDSLALVQAKNNLRLALLDMAQLIEHPDPETLTLVRPSESELATVVGNPEEVYLLSLGERPALRAGELRIKAAEKGIDIAKSAYLPSLSLSANLGTNYYNTSGMHAMSFGRQIKDNFSQGIGLSLGIPIFNRTTRNNVNAARIEQMNSELALEDTKKTLFKDIQNAFYNARGAEQKYKAAQVAESTAAVALRAVTLKYEAGKATASEYDEARNKHFSAATDRIAARYEFMFRNKILDFYRGTPL